MDEQVSVRLRLIQQGDGAALTSLYDQYSRVVYSVALRILKTPACSEDILQEVFMQIWRSPERFLGVTGDFSAWLSVVTRNRSIDLIRRRRPAEPLEDCDAPTKCNVFTTAETNLTMERITSLVQQLPSDQQMAFKLAFLEGMTHSEISIHMGYPLGTIKTRIRKAIQFVKLNLKSALSVN